MSAQAEIVVHRCLVRIIRHGGWSWGPDPQGLVAGVMRALPEVIAERLRGVDPGAGDLGRAEPLRIEVSLRLGELLAWQPEPADGAAAVRVGVAAEAPIRVERPPPTPTSAAPVVDVPGPSAANALLWFLAAAHVRGELEALLALLPPSTLEAWHGALLARPRRLEAGPGGRLAGGRGARAAAGSAPPAGPPPEDLPPWLLAEPGEQGPRDDLLAPLGPVPDQEGWLRGRLVALAAFAARVGVAEAALLLGHGLGPGPGQPAPGGRQGHTPPGAWHEQGPAAAMPGGGAGDPQAPGAPEGDGRPPAVRPEPAATPGPRPASPPPGIVPARPAAAGADVEVASALPFLLLGPLATVGWLQTVHPALEAAGLAREAASCATALATGLAYTVLPPPERGWRRRETDLAAAAAFAGLATPLPEPVLVESARLLPAALPALDALLVAALAQGHSPGEPLLLARASASDPPGSGGGLVLADREGLFPITWADEIGDLLPAWRACGSPTMLVAPGAAGTAVLRALHAAGVGFVVGVPPTRHERWRRLPPPPPQRLWSNDLHSPLALLRRQAAGFPELADRLDDLLHAFAEERPAVPLAASPALGRSLLLAAALALGTIAWTLWRDREAPDPLLALERFGDLVGRVSFDERRIRVRLPLGRRHDDLLGHGLLADVHGVPWLGGRVVEFSGG